MKQIICGMDSDKYYFSKDTDHVDPTEAGLQFNELTYFTYIFLLKTLDSS